jgi:hypothetical protein
MWICVQLAMVSGITKRALRFNPVISLAASTPSMDVSGNPGEALK